uniref:BTB domain-containing protein n=1 Tax=Leersia perrieri TaxID=77586 RepID=A0A0D9X7Q5_9ORYZ
MSTHSTELVSGTHQFTVAGYSLQKRKGVGHFIRSNSFKVGGYNWAIRFYPAGVTGGEGYVAMYLELMETTAVAKVTVKSTFTIGSSLPFRGWDDFTSSSKSWGYRKFMKIDEVESRYLINDCVTLYCQVEIVQEKKTGATAGCSITVKQSEYHAHKVVLAARSPVFRAQFFGAMAMASVDGDRHVRIHDMKPAVFEAVLHFVYTDTLPPVGEAGFRLSGRGHLAKLKELVAGGLSMKDRRVMVGEWLAAADRYDLERMRLLCEDMLCKTIDVANAATTLQLADRHHCPQLKASCIKYLIFPGMMAAVVSTEGFREFKAAACSSLLAEVLEKTATDKNKWYYSI